MARAAAHTDVPVAVGFGIATPEQAAAAEAGADGVIVGSRLVRAAGEAADPAAAVRELVAGFAAALLYYTTPPPRRHGKKKKQSGSPHGTAHRFHRRPGRLDRRWALGAKGFDAFMMTLTIVVQSRCHGPAR